MRLQKVVTKLLGDQVGQELGPEACAQTGAARPLQAQA